MYKVRVEENADWTNHEEKRDINSDHLRVAEKRGSNGLERLRVQTGDGILDNVQVSMEIRCFGRFCLCFHGKLGLIYFLQASLLIRGLN